MSDSELINWEADRLTARINDRLRTFAPIVGLSESRLAEAQAIADHMAGDCWDVIVLEKLIGEPRYTAHVRQYKGNRGSSQYHEYRPDEYG